MPFRLTDKLNKFKGPETNGWIISQEEHLAFHVLTKKRELVYVVTAKAAATRSIYFIKKNDDQVAQIVQDPIENKYKINIGDTEGEIKITKDQIGVYFDDTLFAKPHMRAKEFDFYLDKDLVFTIDKQTLTLHDKYKIEYTDRVDALLPVIVAICIDDSFHGGLIG